MNDRLSFRILGGFHRQNNFDLILDERFEMGLWLISVAFGVFRVTAGYGKRHCSPPGDEDGGYKFRQSVTADVRTAIFQFLEERQRPGTAYRGRTFDSRLKVVVTEIIQNPGG